MPRCSGFGSERLIGITILASVPTDSCVGSELGRRYEAPCTPRWLLASSLAGRTMFTKFRASKKRCIRDCASLAIYCEVFSIVLLQGNILDPSVMLFSRLAVWNRDDISS